MLEHVQALFYRCINDTAKIVAYSADRQPLLCLEAVIQQYLCNGSATNGETSIIENVTTQQIALIIPPIYAYLQTQCEEAKKLLAHPKNAKKRKRELVESEDCASTLFRRCQHSSNSERWRPQTDYQDRFDTVCGQVLQGMVEYEQMYT